MYIYFNNDDGSQVGVNLNEELKPCPFCGDEVGLKRNKLWTDSGHGYKGCYEYIIRCDNPDCSCNIKLPKNNTIYNNDQDAVNNAIKAWNTRTDKSKQTLRFSRSQSCLNCKFFNTYTDSDPCKSCVNEDKWEARDDEN